jgi:transposase-like protein
MVAVRWYLRFGLSYVEKLLAERGITVDHVTVSCNAASRAVMPLCGR